MNRTALSTKTDVAPSGERLISLDALRGFDMFWIVGAGGLVAALNEVGGKQGILQFLAGQLRHADWEGFTFNDLIFPLFVFLIGVSLVLSLGKLIEREGKAAAYKRLVRRFVLLYLLGIFYYGGLGNLWPDIRLLGVLQRLALCYLFVGLLFCNLRLPGLIVTCGLLLVGYWAAMMFIPVPGQGAAGPLGAGSFGQENNLAWYVDYHFLPGRLYNKTWDPEGILSTIPAVASCLLGVFAGRLITDKTTSNAVKVIALLAGGAILASLGYLWGMQFPIIKKIWTSSYVLMAGGYSCLLLGAFYLVIDVWKFRKWATPFVWLGSNAITVYMAWNIVEFDDLARRFVGGNVQQLLDPYGQMATAVVTLLLTFALARFLYRRGIFLRV